MSMGHSQPRTRSPDCEEAARTAIAANTAREAGYSACFDEHWQGVSPSGIRSYGDLNHQDSRAVISDRDGLNEEFRCICRSFYKAGCGGAEGAARLALNRTKSCVRGTFDVAVLIGETVPRAYRCQIAIATPDVDPASGGDKFVVILPDQAQAEGSQGSFSTARRRSWAKIQRRQTGYCVERDGEWRRLDDRPQTITGLI